MDLFSDLPDERPAPLSVTQCVRQLQRLLEANIPALWIEGEVSNLRRQASGHWYFTLKDERAQISCVIFHARNKANANAVVDGAMVRVRAEPTIYEGRGQLQLIITHIEASGIGELQRRFEALKQRLHAEGLFAAEHKKALPAFARVIGIITSPTGAVLRDILQVLERRAPWIVAVLLPVRVQGKGAEVEIARAIAAFNAAPRGNIPHCDLLIIGRGGGSLEDLWPFNEELTARAIFASKIPIVSAVGHETDFTIADMVADVRAATPSVAAELASPDGSELKAQLLRLRQRLERSVAASLKHAEQRLRTAKRRHLRLTADRLLGQLELKLEELTERLPQGPERWLLKRATSLHTAWLQLRHLDPRKQRFIQIDARLQQLAEAQRHAALRKIDWQMQQLEARRLLLRSLGPTSVLDRGFSITRLSDGTTLRCAEQAPPGTALITTLKHGQIHSTSTARPT